MTSSPVRVLTLSALFTAMVTVVTWTTGRFPIPAVQGYNNVGDSVIFVAALLMGPRIGLLAGGIGSALADVLVPGSAVWAPWTLVIKGLEGFIVGAIGYRVFQARGTTPTVLGAILVGGLWMVLGYFMVARIHFHEGAALMAVPRDLIQMAVSAAIALPLLHALRRVKLLG